MSIFLMGVWDPDTKRWCTVARCGNGHDDKTIEKLNKELKMTKISKVFSTFFDPASTFLERPVLRSLMTVLESVSKAKRMDAKSKLNLFSFQV